MAWMEALAAELRAGPQWVFWWVNFMGIVIMAAIPFAFSRVEARWTLAAMIPTVVLMGWLYNEFGYQRILGLAHVLFWTPLVFYFWKRRAEWRVRETLGGKWVLLVFTVMCASLVMDYADVVRYLLGERL